MIIRLYYQTIILEYGGMEEPQQFLQMVIHIPILNFLENSQLMGSLFLITYYIQGQIMGILHGFLMVLVLLPLLEIF